MPKYNETNGKTMSYSILKKTTGEKYQKRKKQCVDPLPVKKIKFKTKEDSTESAEWKEPVPRNFVSELNVLPEMENSVHDRFEENERDPWLECETMDQGIWLDSETTESPALQELEKVIQDTQPKSETNLQDKPSPSEIFSPYASHHETPPEGEETPLEEEGCNTIAGEACNDTNKEVYEESKEKDYVEYYVNGYCLRNNMKDQYYARNHLGDELYWRDSVNAEIYAYKTVNVNETLHKMEYPAMQKNEPKYIYDRAGKPRYPVDLATQAVIFPKNPETNEEIYLPDRKGNLFYPENKFGQQFYRKDAEGNEVLINNTYAKYADGSQIYPKKSNEDEFYLTLGNLEVPAIKRIDKKYVPYYAQKKNGDQIYPREYVESGNDEVPENE